MSTDFIEHTGLVLQTKLYRPPLQADLVARKGLIELLERERNRPLTLISAPAGYGKSILAAQWLERSSLPGAWLSLDEGDNSPRSFLAYFVAAVRQHAPTACQSIHRLLNAAELPQLSVLADMLGNELEALSAPFILVLDDFHRITNVDIYVLLDRLLAYPPRSLHLVILTRQDPPLRIAVMRASGLAVEIREADLRFSAEETRSVLHNVADVTPDPDTLASIMVDLEGWIVGLRMLCLALRNGGNLHGYLSGQHGHIAQVHEYLAEQVLSRQSPELQRCLQRTSILERFCAPLCEVLCCSDEPGAAHAPQFSGQAFIRAVSESNLFTVDLDDRGEWLRYHHLFQELLRRQLEKKTKPAEIRALHERVSRWFAAQGQVDEALKHAIAAGATEVAADIVEMHRVSALNADQWPILANWLARLPEEVTWERPELLLGEAWLAYYRFRIPALIRIITRIDELLRKETARPAWTGEAAMFKAYLSYWQGQSQEMLTHVATAQNALPSTHDLARADSEIYFGLAHHQAGQEQVAIDALTRRISEQPDRKGLLITRLVITLAFIHLLAGRLTVAMIYSRQLGQLAPRHSPVYIESWSRYLQGCCHFHSGDWQEAERCFRWLADNRYVAHTGAVMSSLVGLCVTLHFMGRGEEATAIAELLLDHAVESEVPENLLLAQSGRARLGLLQGNTAERLLSHEGATMATAFVFLEVPGVTVCRCLVARGSRKAVEQALAEIESLQVDTETNHNTCHLIDLLALKAVALARLERHDAAVEVLEKALELAEPGGWVRPFVEQGAPMAELLAGLRRAGRTGYLERILGAFAQQRTDLDSPANSEVPPAGQPIDLLTHRELDVLERLAERLYDKEIADRLHISLSTVKTHLRHIYEKLAVSNRRQAVIKAEQLGLLQRR